ncbi:MAG: thiamine pyrophosphate-requiring protein [Chloroflexi bacterium]|nr:thiamine pyrophosphate-requiring protein [Chloroflexota bacterium]
MATAVEQHSTQGTGIESFNETAEAFLTLALAHGSSKIFINPGTDTFPIQESWARRMEQSLPVPLPVQCLHEHVAVAAAHGYYLATGDPQVVLVHVDAGTINAGGALHNAQRGDAGIVMCAGRAPYTWEGELRGGKSSIIHWYQEQPDQAGILRNYVKWHYELSRSENVAGIVERAFQVARNEPAGPVYLTLPREVLMLPAQNVRFPDARHSGPATAPAPDRAAIERAAVMLAGAERPVIVAARNGRDHKSVPELVKLAELIGARVVDSRHAMNMPHSHPLNVGGNDAAELPKADVILFLDSDVLYVPNLVRPNPDAKVIQIDVDPVHERYVIWNFPVDLRITSSTALALPALRAAVEDVLTNAQQQRVVQRAREIGLESEQQRAAAKSRAEGKATTNPMDPEWVAYCVAQVMPEDALLVDESLTNRPATHAHVKRDEPGSVFFCGGSSLGFAIGAAIGVKLARPDRPVISMVGDGGFMFGHPVPAIWGAQKHGAPSLTVIYNNAGYKASGRNSIQNMYPEGVIAKTGDAVVDMFDPPPDHAKVAEACGAYGVKVSDPGELPAALRKAMDEVLHGRSAVVDAVVKKANL